MGRMQISVTFDGGFESAEAEAILDTLYARGIKTTVFLTGLFIERHPDVARRIVRDGHEVGNHTMTHPHLTEYTKSFRQKRLPSIDRAFIARELKEVERLFRKTTGAEMARFWRAPYGEINAEIRLWAYEAGYLHVGWTSDWKTRESLDSLDWVSDRASRLYRTP
ncbi:MAG: polysaccharide deacetylase family protein, partial [Deltaproteobacteria bacterium]|nr:polysaccharide deacetylase family protein [Deltaproteobacteria bacterium]